MSEVDCKTGLDRLQPEQRSRLRTLLGKYPQVLTAKLGLTHSMEYEIQVTDNTPVKSSPYRLAPPKTEILRQQVDQLLRDDVIEPFRSRYSSPVFLVPQPNNSYRALVDYRALNKNIEIEFVPILHVHSTFQWFAKAKYFTTLDLNPVDHQIPLAAASKPLTVSVPSGSVRDRDRGASPDTIAGHDFP